MLTITFQNQFWFFLFIATICLIPAIFFAMKLSNYYRILEPEESDSFDKRFHAEGVPLKTLVSFPFNSKQCKRA